MNLRLLLPLIIGGLLSSAPVFAEESTTKALPGTQPLTLEGDLAAEMVSGIRQFLLDKTSEVKQRRVQFWDRNLNSYMGYEESVQANRDSLATILGVIDDRPGTGMEINALLGYGDIRGRNNVCDVKSVRWQALDGVYGEGLLAIPNGEIIGNVVLLPDCDQNPELYLGLEGDLPLDHRIALHLASLGCQVLVPTLIDRGHEHSGNPDVRMTQIPHREMVYRGAYEMGRHIIGYEIEKVLTAVDWFEMVNPDTPIAVLGYGEGGLLAFYSGALDNRIDVTLVSGYFGPRKNLWKEPIYRNVWSLLTEFGDAEIASLIAPRALLIETAPAPKISHQAGQGLTPGSIEPFAREEIEKEFHRALDLIEGLDPQPNFQLIENASETPFSLETTQAVVSALGLPATGEIQTWIMGNPVPDPLILSSVRQKRQFDQLIEFTQEAMEESEFVRGDFWSDADPTNLQTWTESTEPYREYFWEEVIGRLPDPTAPPNARTRQIYETEKWTGYEVWMDVFPGVPAYGILLVPKDIAEGEKRPVVVCQHGLEGRPQELTDPEVDSHYYHQFAGKLADEGFITYSPQNPYIGGDDFRVLQRIANPIGLSIFSVITAQHQQTLNWLKSFPEVDPERIGFYGLSYGGKTAMRVPALLTDYCLSICSGDFNEWIWKNVSFDHKYSYLFTGEYEMFEFDLGNTFNYAELTWLILPRPFMVERGHFDGVAPDRWVAYEYSRTFEKYDLFGLRDKTEIEYFTGPHTIHGEGTFEFLRKHLNWNSK
ncbi:MAG: hypothetical protein H6752_11885 [Candidatus Omnitrophica bacterium]|nr:hypothetical protein [Candidatus Omnitrophota bacterium]